MKVLIVENDVLILTALERLMLDFGFQAILAYDSDDLKYAVDNESISFLVFNRIFAQNTKISKILDKECSDCSFISYFLESNNLKKTVYFHEQAYDSTLQNTAEMISALVRLYFLKNGFSILPHNICVSECSETIYNPSIISPECLVEFRKSLTKKTEKIFNILNKNSENGVKPSEIAKKIWGTCSEKTLNSLYVHISFIRKKLKTHLKDKYTIQKKDKTYRLTVHQSKVHQTT